MSHGIFPNRAQIWLLPPSIDDWVVRDHPVRFVAAFVEQLDLEEVGFRQSPGVEGRPHYAPELLLSVWLFGWMERIRTSRALEKACQRDVAFFWLTGNMRLDHVTLWRFFDSNKAALKKLFKKIVQIAANAGLIGFALHALDGTKMRAASSMDSALHRKQLELLLKKLDPIVDASIATTEAEEASPEPSWRMPEGLQTPEGMKKKIRDALEKLKEPRDPGGPQAPAGTSSTVPAEARDGAEVAKADVSSRTQELTKQELIGALDHLKEHGTQHLHPNEVEARVMRTQEGSKLAYNAQIVVDHDSDLIVAMGVSGDETDHEQLVPMIEQVRETCGQPAEQTVADKGYASGSQFDEAQRRRLPVIVDVQVESKKGPYAKSNFTYDADRDVYVCPRGEVLPFQMSRKPTANVRQPQHVYRCHNAACPARAECTQDKKGRTIKRLDTEEAFNRQVELQSTPEKKVLLGLRKEIVEHIFGIAKTIDGFRRFTAFGIAGAAAQWALACLAINMRKLVAFWREGRISLAAAA